MSTLAVLWCLSLSGNTNVQFHLILLIGSGWVTDTKYGDPRGPRTSILYMYVATSPMTDLLSIIIFRGFTHNARSYPVSLHPLLFRAYMWIQSIVEGQSKSEDACFVSAFLNWICHDTDSSLIVSLVSHSLPHGQLPPAGAWGGGLLFRLGGSISLNNGVNIN
jgi:hypothetical protein